MGYSQDLVSFCELEPMALEVDMRAYDQTAAIHMAALAELSYWDESRLHDYFTLLRGKPEYSSVRHMVVKNKHAGAFVLLVRYPQGVVLAFRGTQFLSLRDWYNNLKTSSYENTVKADPRLKGLPTGHAGFRRSMLNLARRSALLDSLDVLMKTYDTPKEQIPIFLTGHSLGGGLGAMMIGLLEGQDLLFGGAYFFASPLAIHCDRAAELSDKFGDRVHEVVNEKDFIARAGSRMRARNRHFGEFYRIGPDKLLRKEAECYARMSKGERRIVRMHRLRAYRLALASPNNSTSGLNSRAGEVTYPDIPAVDRTCAND